MTKETYLYSLIDMKDSHNTPLITFPREIVAVSTKQNLLFQDIVEVFLEEGELCLFVESKKGIVEPIEPLLANTTQISYRIDSTQLRTNYIYEDQLVCYYPGGQGTIHFTVLVHEEDISCEELNRNKALQGENNGIKSIKKVVLDNNVKPLIKSQQPKVDIALIKKAFAPTETIIMTLTNRSNRPIRVVLECEDELVSPKMTEVFLNEVWSQEWFIRQSKMDKWLGKFSFKSDPFKRIPVKIFYEESLKPDKNIELILTSYEPYETIEIIQEEDIFIKKKTWIFHQYILRIIQGGSRREISELFECSKVCLNYDPSDVDLRLLYIWLLFEYNHKREALQEYTNFSVYKDYYAKDKRAKLIELIGRMVEKEDIAEAFFEPINTNTHWLEMLIKARQIHSRARRYEVYKELYNQGIRHSLMFAEVTSLLNETPIIPVSDDDLYYVTLKWAFNKMAVGKDWINKIDRHYYQLEKSQYMTSHLAQGIYNLRKTNNLLKLFVLLSIKEERYDLVCFEFYEEAIKQKIYISNIEDYYLKAAWKNKEVVNLELLKHFTKTMHLSVPVQAYLFSYVIRHQTENPMLFRRLKTDILNFIVNSLTIEEEVSECIYLLTEELVKNHLEVLNEIVKESKIQQLYLYESGKRFIQDMIVLCITENPKLQEVSRDRFINVCVKAIGYEGLVICLGEEAPVLYEYFVNNKLLKNKGGFEKRNTMSLLFELDKSTFLPIKYYEEILIEQNSLEKLLKQILIDDFLEEIISTYHGLNEDVKTRIAPLVFNYVAKQIIIDDIYIQEPLYLELYDYFTSVVETNKGMLLALLKVGIIYKDTLKEQLVNLKKRAMEHVIIVPWIGEEMDILSIEYLTKYNDVVYMYYRYEEDEAFKKVQMNHVAYGFFIYSGKLFYRENFEYYLVVEHVDGRREIPLSDRLTKVDFYEKENHHVDYRLNSITLSFEIDDEKSARELIQEQEAYNKLIRRIPRYM